MQRRGEGLSVCTDLSASGGGQHQAADGRDAAPDLAEGYLGLSVLPVQELDRHLGNAPTPARAVPEHLLLEGIAPGDDVVRLCAVRVRNEEGKVTDTIDIRNPVGVEMEFEVLEPGHNLFVYFHVVNEEGIEVFTSNCTDTEWIGRPRLA